MPPYVSHNKNLQTLSDQGEGGFEPIIIPLVCCIWLPYLVTNECKTATLSLCSVVHDRNLLSNWKLSNWRIYIISGEMIKCNASSKEPISNCTGFALEKILYAKVKDFRIF